MTEQFVGYRKRGLIQVPVFTDSEPEVDLDTLGPIERMLAEMEWTPEELRAAHAAYARGNRDAVTVEGHRIWDMNRKWQARGRMSDEDRRWAEKAARDGFWRQWERRNRVSDARDMLEQALTML